MSNAMVSEPVAELVWWDANVVRSDLTSGLSNLSHGWK